MDQRPVLVTGSTGYVGGRLTPLLLEKGFQVRALGRSKAKLAARPWAGHPNLELAQGDVLDLASLKRALEGCRAAYYLVHSMNPATKDFAKTDRQAALNMRAACEAAGLERVIYLGGIIPQGQAMSHHLRSRAEVGRILQGGGVPATWLRAAMILGSGSASFEIMRYLVERLPVMITPRWVRSLVQPIAVSNVLGYLAGCLEHPRSAGRTYDICGPDVLTYEELFRIYAQEAGLRQRLVIPLPLLSPKLSSYWIHLVTPVHASLARPLAEGLSNSVTCSENRIRELMPQELLTCRQAIGDILAGREERAAQTCWMDAGALEPPAWAQGGDAPYAGGDVLQDAFRVRLDKPPAQVWPVVKSLGAGGGMYHGQALWDLRGWLDKLAGGVGSARGRRHPSELLVGDALGFWRVLEIREGVSLVLLAEMKAPGEALLFIRLSPGGAGSWLTIMGRFLPKGLAGLAYWHGLHPWHAWLYKGMLKSMARRAGARILAGPEPFQPNWEEACLLQD
ncbi:epimerase [Desulfocarbo indianensis]|nr:epimerase [Desulfocarbo indianensis]